MKGSVIISWFPFAYVELYYIWILKVNEFWNILWQSFLLAIILSIGVGNCESANLTAITWRHEVNSYDALQEALASKFLDLFA